MRTQTWRNKLALIAGATLTPAGIALLVAAPAAGAAAGHAPAHSAGASASPQAAPPARAHASGAASQPSGAASQASDTVSADPVTSSSHGPGNGNPPASRSGDNGTVKIHNSTTPVTDPRNEPHVCHFYLDGFGFDAGQPVSWHIESWPPTGDRSTVAQGTLTMDGNGNGHTWPPMTLDNGHYKLFWNFTGEHGSAKHKVFWVKCPGQQTPPPTTPPPSPAQTPTPSSSSSSSSAAVPPGQAPPGQAPPGHGGLPVTGWPLALIAGAGAALLGTGGTALAMAARRYRGLHAR